jgi:hypothetical protein
MKDRGHPARISTGYGTFQKILTAKPGQNVNTLEPLVPSAVAIDISEVRDEFFNLLVENPPRVANLPNPKFRILLLEALYVRTHGLERAPLRDIQQVAAIGLFVCCG